MNIEVVLDVFMPVFVVVDEDRVVFVADEVRRVVVATVVNVEATRVELIVVVVVEFAALVLVVLAPVWRAVLFCTAMKPVGELLDEDVRAVVVFADDIEVAMVEDAVKAIDEVVELLEEKFRTKDW